MAPGFLAVLSEPGDQVSLDEFHDWYNNEHIPLRLNHLPSFLSGARYQSIDGIKPSWIAAYEIDDTKTFKYQSYTVLREKRSQREKDVIGRLEVLDRRTCEVVREVASNRQRTTGLKVGNPSRWIVTHGVGRADGGNAEYIGQDHEGFEQVVVKWLDRVVAKLQDDPGVDGWVKTRVVKVVDSAKTRANPAKNHEEEQGVLSHFVFHEFISQESANSPTFRKIIEEHGAELSVQFSEFRRWGLYKSYPCVAQGNVNLKAQGLPSA